MPRCGQKNAGKSARTGEKQPPGQKIAGKSARTLGEPRRARAQRTENAEKKGLAERGVICKLLKDSSLRSTAKKPGFTFRKKNTLLRHGKGGEHTPRRAGAQRTGNAGTGPLFSWGTDLPFPRRGRQSRGRNCRGKTKKAKRDRGRCGGGRDRRRARGRGAAGEASAPWKDRCRGARAATRAADHYRADQYPRKHRKQ